MLTPRRATAAAVVAALALGAWSLSPALRVGWYGDDAAYAYLGPALALRHQSLADAVVQANLLWMALSGRIYPAAIALKYALFDGVRDPVAYKAVVLALTLAALGAFYGLARAVAGTRTALAALLVASVTPTLRAYHDSVLAYNGMLQVLFLAFAGSLFALRRALAGGGRLWTVAALVLYAWAALTYEIADALFPLHALVARGYRDVRGAVVAALPFAALAGVLVAAWQALRVRADLAPDGVYAVGASPAAFAVTLAKQLVASLPLSYELADPQHIFPPLAVALTFRAAPFAFAFPIGVLAGALAFGIVRYAAREAPRPGELQPREQVLVALGLAVLPAPLIAVAAKYQRELVFGLGYLPVFVQGFGVALLLGMMLARLPRASGAAAAAGGLVGLVAWLTAGGNALVGSVLADELGSRPAVERALAAGLLDPVPDDGRIVVGSRMPWLCTRETGCPDGLFPEYFVHAYAGRIVLVDAPNAVRDPSVPTFDLSYTGTPGGAEAVTLAPRKGGAERAFVRRSPAPCAARVVRSGPSPAPWVLVELPRAANPLAPPCPGAVRPRSG